MGFMAAKGSGFVVHKLERGRWSAPVFFVVKQLGVGITAGEFRASAAGGGGHEL